MTHDLISALQRSLGEHKVLNGTAVAGRYHHIWKMNEPLKAIAVLLPQSTEDVAAAMKICHQYDQPVAIHGGLTNLVGATETTENEVVISLEKLNNIVELDEKSRTITVEAGVILENVQMAAAEKDLLFPLNFGAKGSAQIGGAISTNAGGLRVFRYGMTRSQVLGIEAVLADGTIVSSLKKLIKDNSGYDLKQLFVGSEGTLGIVTKAVLRLVAAPKSRCSAFVGFNEYDKIISFLKYMDSGLAGTLSGYELIWQPTYQKMTTPETVKLPLPTDYKYYILLDSLGSNQEQDHATMTALLEQAMENDMIADAVMTHSQSDIEWFWSIREDVHVVASNCTIDQHFDVSMPIALIGKYVDDTMVELSKVEGVNACYPFGHVADGNVHFIVDKANDSDPLREKINDVVYNPLRAIGGSVSAEHGIGVHKKRYLHLCRSPAEITLMKTLKTAMDPKNLLNRGKIF